MRSMAQPEHQSSEATAAVRYVRASYIAAAAPAHALLSCINARAKTFLTADPIPFANSVCSALSEGRSADQPLLFALMTSALEPEGATVSFQQQFLQQVRC